MPAGTIGAGLVEQPLADILPDGMRPIEPDCIRLLNFDDARTALALDAQDVALDFRESALLDRQLRLSGCARIGQEARP